MHADVEDIGAFTVFVTRSQWPFYARPRLGPSTEMTVDDVQQVLDRQRELHLPRSIEWVAETTPHLEQAALGAGMHVEHCPLMVLHGEPRGGPGSARMLGPDDVDDFALSRAAVGIAFRAGGTRRGREGIDERDTAARAAGPLDPAAASDLATGRARVAAAYPPTADLGPVGGGSHTPIADTSEITGVAVLPAYRGQGLAAALSHVLAQDAIHLGVTTIFCSAQNHDVARIYQRIGFRHVATACIGTA